MRRRDYDDRFDRDYDAWRRDNDNRARWPDREHRDAGRSDHPGRYESGEFDAYRAGRRERYGPAWDDRQAYRYAGEREPYGRFEERHHGMNERDRERERYYGERSRDERDRGFGRYDDSYEGASWRGSDRGYDSDLDYAPWRPREERERDVHPRTAPVERHWSTPRWGRADLFDDLGQRGEWSDERGPRRRRR